MILPILKKKRQLYKVRLEDLETKKQERLEILSQNPHDLHTQVTRIKQTIKKVLGKGASLAERSCTLLHEQGITISVLPVLFMTNASITLAITGLFGRGTAASGSSPP